MTGTRTQNASDTATASSAQSGVIAAIPTANVTPPQVSGTIRQGFVVFAALGGWNGTHPLAYTYLWERCDVTCTQVATGSSYGVAAADVGKRLKVTVTATGPGGSDTAASPLSAVVAAGFPGVGAPGATPGTRRLRRLSPFPVVAIGGRIFRSGVVVSQLRISRAPTGATVTVTCKGRDCPFKRARRTIRRRSGLRLKGLEKALRRGTVIVIVVRKGNTIGKYTRLRIRTGAPPARLDRCIRPGARGPSACPG